MKIVRVHWLFKEPSSARSAESSIVLRPIIRQRKGGRLRECMRCAAIGKELGIP